MRQTLFTITCTTCRVRLAVRSEAAIGAILECPKCGCMVPVLPPEGWQPPRPAERSVAQSQQSPLPLGQTQLQQSPLRAPTEGWSGEGQGEGISGQDIVSTDASAVVGKGTLFRPGHSWYWITAASAAAAAIGVVVWLTMFSGTGSNNSVKPTVEQSTAASADASVSSELNNIDQQAPEQSAAIDKNEPAMAAALNPNNKVEEPEQKTPEVNTPQVKTPVDEKNDATKAEPPQNTEPAPRVMGMSKLVKLVAPEEIDVQSRLGDVIPGVEFREMPFARAVGLVAALSGLPITIDPDAMALLQVSLHDPITVRLTNATVEEVLQQIVAKRGMAFVAEDGQIVVTSPAEQREKLRRVRYTVSDLTDNDKSATDHLAALVQKLVAPESWLSGGGQGTMETEKTALAVLQTGAVHDQILVFCEKLRNARGRPLKSNRDPKRFEMSTRLQQADPALNREIIANFHEPATLVEILAYLGRQAEVDILLDRQALGAAGLSDKSEIAFAAENCPLAVALNELLIPLKLDYRPIDAHTLQVTTQSALAARLELEFYPVGKILGKDVVASDLIEQIKTKISPASWTAANSSAAIYVDQPSTTLIVLQSPPVQAAIQVFLNKTMKNQK